MILEYVEPEYIAVRETFYITHVIPYNISDTPLISDWYSKECEELVLKIINQNSHIKKAVFVYDLNRKFLAKYDGVMDALKMCHLTIKKHAKIGDVYKGFIFSYERLID